MSIQGRIDELSNKHRDLDEKIEFAQKRPARDPLEVSELKRRKLRIKEQLKELGR